MALWTSLLPMQALAPAVSGFMHIFMTQPMHVTSTGYLSTVCTHLELQIRPSN